MQFSSIRTTLAYSLLVIFIIIIIIIIVSIIIDSVIALTSDRLVHCTLLLIL